MEIVFRSLPAELMHTCIDPATGKKYRFTERTNPHTVSAEFGAHLIKSNPMVFGATAADIDKARGINSQKAKQSVVRSGRLVPQKQPAAEAAAKPTAAKAVAKPKPEVE